MKTALLLCALAGCLLLLIWQRSDATARAARDARSLSELQAKYDAAAGENRALRLEMQRKQAIRGALASAVPVAARYSAPGAKR